MPDGSVAVYLALIGAITIERMAELRLSVRNAAFCFERGGREHGRGHYPFMVALHGTLLIGCVVEVALVGRPFVPLLGWPMLGVAVLAQALRWWCIATLGPRWNTRVIVIPGLPRIVDGPYRWLRHPNYLAVVAEGLALPLVHSAWFTAIGFSVANAALLAARIRCEDEAFRL